ncbi:hypothetical protein BU15DRAFT_79456 [Melanogaster broomeanus]|nr:hypothetical protein BU15DRAFT_79456 [Melanogaster broomeanus]
MDPSLKKRLETLQHYLSNLPDILPLPGLGLAKYNFDLFNISAEDIEDYGEVGAVNRQLEISFGSRHDGPVLFTERGPALVQVVEVLNTYLLKDPTSAILQKWVDDLTTSAELSFSMNGISIPSLPRFHAPLVLPKKDQVGEATASTADTRMGSEMGHRPKQGSRQVQKLDSKILGNSHDPDYEDMVETIDSRKSGAKTLPLLLRGARAVIRPGAGLVIANAYLSMLQKCGYIDGGLRQDAEDELNKKAIGPPAIVPGSQSRARMVEEEMDVTETITQTTPATSSAITPLVTILAPGPSQTKLKGFQTEGRKVLQDRGDYAVMKFFVCCGIPPSNVDADEFKDMVSALNPTYHPPCSTTLEDKLIVNKAAKIGHAVRIHLQGCRNLTITFDGGKIRKPKSVYTIHVTTADRHAFCMELDDASLLSHSADYILEALDQDPGKCSYIYDWLCGIVRKTGW